MLNTKKLDFGLLAVLLAVLCVLPFTVSVARVSRFTA